MRRLVAKGPEQCMVLVWHSQRYSCILQKKYRKGARGLGDGENRSVSRMDRIVWVEQTIGVYKGLQIVL